MLSFQYRSRWVGRGLLAETLGSDLYLGGSAAFGVEVLML